MTSLGIADLVEIAARLMRIDPRSARALLDVDAAHRALSEACADPVGLADRAASLLHALLRRRPLPGANAAFALLATVQLLNLNGCDLDLEPPEEVHRMTSGAARGDIGMQELSAWLAGRLRPLSRQGCRPWEKEAEMFERFTKDARQVVVRAQEEARALQHNYIGTEHILLGLIGAGGEVGAALGAAGVTNHAVRSEVERIIGRGTSTPAGAIPFTPRAKKVLELALREAIQLRGGPFRERQWKKEGRRPTLSIEAPHLLLGIIREGEGVAAAVLVQVAGDLGRLREEVLRALHTGNHGESGTTEERRRDLLQQIKGVLDENEELRSEVGRLRDLLRSHSIEPNGGTRTA